MSKKLSQALLIPTMTVLPLMQAMAEPPEHHPKEAPLPHMVKSTIREILVRGKIINTNTIQVNTQDLLKNNSSDQMRVITTTDEAGNKQRFILLTPDRSNLGQTLLAAHGRLKEFNLYSVVNENGENTPFLASKRVVTAPANQLTILFPSRQDVRVFFTEKTLEMLANQQIKLLTSVSELSANNEMAQEETQEYSQQINDINNEITAHAQDQKKSKVMEPIELFPMRAAILIPVITATHDM